ncbi:hypothetical protein CRM22_006388, partial [Opisthorchis felineus]
AHSPPIRMAPDPFIKYFKALKKDLSSLVERYDAFFKHEEEFPTLFGKTELFGPRSGRPLSAVLSNLEQALKVHENFQTVNEKYFLKPLEKVCAIVPSISSLFSEREDLVKDLDKLKKKQQKMETMERTGENLAKLSKVVAQVESGNIRLSAIDTLIDRDLKELTSRTELFLGRIIKVDILCCRSYLFPLRYGCYLCMLSIGRPIFHHVI